MIRSATHSGGHSALGLVLRAAGGRRQAAAQSVEQFYKGRTITMLVGTSPGGINDISARLVGATSRPFHSGQPERRRAEQSRAAAASSRPTASISIRDKDGSVLAKLERAVPQLAIQGDPNAQFDPAKFTWLGSLSSYADDAYLMLVNANHPAKTIADLKQARHIGDARRRHCRRRAT